MMTSVTLAVVSLPRRGARRWDRSPTRSFEVEEAQPGHIMTSPKQLGKYQIEARVGEGGMGVVYRAFDPDLQQAVAIKVIRKELIEGASGYRAEDSVQRTKASLYHRKEKQSTERPLQRPMLAREALSGHLRTILFSTVVEFTESVGRSPTFPVESGL